MQESLYRKRFKESSLPMERNIHSAYTHHFNASKYYFASNAVRNLEKDNFFHNVGILHFDMSSDIYSRETKHLFRQSYTVPLHTTDQL